MLGVLTIVTAVVCVIPVVIYLYLTWNFNHWRKRRVRGPRPTVLKGNFAKTEAGQCNFIEELHEIYLKYKNNDKFIGIFAARSPRIFVLDPTLALQILTTNFRSFHDNESSKWTNPKTDKLRSASPFISIGESWKKKRSDINPALTVSRLRSFYPVMQEAAEKLTTFIRTHRENVDAKQLSGRFTTELIANFIWGIDAEAFGSDGVCTVQEISSGMINQAMKCVRFYSKTAAWPWLRKLRPERFFSETSDKFFSEITEKSLAHRSERPNDRPDVLNYLLQLREKKLMTTEQLAGISTTVLIDGFEAAAIGIAHTLLMLGRNKAAQEKLRKEILENIDENSGIGFDRLNELPYLDQCIQETLRIFPPLSTLFKLCTESITLQNFDGVKIPLKPGDTVYISSFSFHRDADIFEKPEEFIPERFDPNVGGSRKYRDMGVFLPFGDGPRMCLGMKLGLVETKVAVAEVVRKFEICVSESTRKDNRVSKDSMLVTLEGGIVLNFQNVE